MSETVSPPSKSSSPSSGRRVRKIVTVVLVVLAVLVGVDFAGAAFAEHTVSQKARQQLGLDSDPDVGIGGFPFLTQAVAGEYGHITVEAKSVPVQDVLQDVGIKAELYDVDAPLSDLAQGNVDNVTIDRVEGEVTLKASDINRVSPLDNIEDLQIAASSEAYVRNGEGSGEQATDTDDSANTGGDADRAPGAGAGDGSDGDPVYGPDGDDNDDSSAGIRLSGKVQVAGQEKEIFAFAIIELDGSSITITPHRLQFGNDQETTVVPRAVQRQLLPSFEADINAGQLPFTVTPTAVVASPDGITVRGEAEHVAFTGANASR
ncbi:DUF2993 domain-containing protein [Prauserella halophila]|uniref:DUF2993 domain-containing protein n=1 Tax=Prauserella halophila TaxID=185641 RepID=A0ABP4GZK8_9PSEU|nr:DUF2993 domain-containing protein [Prauserella halophila]MCP2236988.1 Protein of unknown function (DUF2993) [Prauserella halophila]